MCPLTKNVITCSPNTATPTDFNPSSNTGSKRRLGVACCQSSHEIMKSQPISAQTVGSKCYHNFAKPASQCILLFFFSI